MLAASPDHWLFHHAPDADEVIGSSASAPAPSSSPARRSSGANAHPAPGAGEVIETAAGSPAVVQMFFDDEHVETIRTPPDPAFPVAWVSVARSVRGTAIGGVRHLFRDEAAGFHVRLNVEFPVTVPRPMLTAHCWHLAGEFSNWLEFANGTRSPGAS